ncbi:MAG: dihydroorotate dehydrogenase electron transfer subunit [Oscillospiraceae bacterium]|nr:dihydroorotate dehydrogenase electron transfer subunit [Oscillospiraceae bacterium]
MKQEVLTIVGNRPLTDSMMELRLSGDVGAVTVPGQFVNLKLDGFYLRRPISVCDCRPEELTLLYKVVGQGTRALRERKPGETLDVLLGLGNGYDLSVSGDAPLLLGGGAGVPPMYWLCRELIAEGRSCTVILGFNTASEIFYEQEFRDLGAKVIITTADGSRGIQGFVTNPMTDLSYSHFYVCGPEPMLRAVYRASTTSGQFSFEERMGCGFGACMGCSCKTVTGYKRICRDGPVLRKEEILWDR